ncbi:hypothetical protein E1B28_010798 [Marasmius oreades]|uniref:DUF6534 domain-containing protein n=1 Tax=Marasmius oreades TaxID=181124 RepID=A0A9P7URE7_9AGAR|nr:uncharacterized protein E1B28_010798 [Marasmius oreades]KAG7089089.1 hypothetical protein E1B28_010798 [Marasmius oreades]
MPRIRSTSTTLQNLDDTIGAYLIGLVASSILYGIICNQAWTYFFTYRDRLFLRGTVIASLTLVTVHTALHTHASYVMFVTNFSRYTGLDRICILDLELLVGRYCSHLPSVLRDPGLPIGEKEMDYSDNDRWAPTNIILVPRSTGIDNNFSTGTGLTIVQIGFSLALCVSVLGRTFGSTGSGTYLMELATGSQRYLLIVPLALTMVGDILCATTLCYHLQANWTGIRRTDTLIQRLMVYAVSTGALVGAGVLTILLTMVLRPDSYIFVGLFEVFGNLYVLSLLARLNSRIPPSPARPINVTNNEEHYMTSLRFEDCLEGTVQTLDSVASTRAHPNSKQSNAGDGKFDNQILPLGSSAHHIADGPESILPRDDQGS